MESFEQARSIDDKTSDVLRQHRCCLMENAVVFPSNAADCLSGRDRMSSTRTVNAESHMQSLASPIHSTLYSTNESDRVGTGNMLSEDDRLVSNLRSDIPDVEADRTLLRSLADSLFSFSVTDRLFVFTRRTRAAKHGRRLDGKYPAHRPNTMANRDICVERNEPDERGKQKKKEIAADTDARERATTMIASIIPRERNHTQRASLCTVDRRTSFSCVYLV